jgi:hypothetical protein
MGLGAQMGCHQHVVAKQPVDGVVVEVQSLPVLLVQLFVEFLLREGERSPSVDHH